MDYPNAKNIDLTDAFLWLTNDGVALATYNVNEPTYPLRLNENRKTIKLFSNDIGLLSCQLFDKEGAMRIIQGDCTINFGAPLENAVAEQLISKGYPLYYFNHKKCGEIDFLIQEKGQIIPLEVKSGNPNKTGKYEHHALDHVLEIYPEIEKAYVFSKRNIYKEEEKIINLPIYMPMFFPGN